MREGDEGEGEGGGDEFLPGLERRFLNQKNQPITGIKTTEHIVSHLLTYAPKSNVAELVDVSRGYAGLAFTLGSW